MNYFTRGIEMKNYASLSLRLLYGREIMQYREKIRSGVDLRYSGCRLIRSSMVVTPTIRNAHITLGIYIRTRAIVSN